MRRVVYEVTCPGCSKRIRAPSLDERRARMVRHIRNCHALKLMGALVPVPPPEAEVGNQFPEPAGTGGTAEVAT